MRMAEDGPDGPFFSALRSFASRTCYANASGMTLTTYDPYT